MKKGSKPSYAELKAKFDRANRWIQQMLLRAERIAGTNGDITGGHR